MKYYGIDIHKKYSVYIAVDEKGTVVEQGRISNDPQAFAEVINGSPEKAMAVIEASCNWYYIYDLLEELVEEVWVAHPLQTKAIAAAKVKTDKVDATTLAQLLRVDLVPRAYVPPREVRELRELVRYRASLVRMRTRVKNKVHALLTKNGLKHGFSDLFGRRGMEWLAALELRPVYKQALEGYLRLLDSLEAEIVPISRELRAKAAADPEARLLMSVPGIGYYSALLILSEIGEVERFPSAKPLVSWAGLAPSVYSSGGKTRHGRITKQGSSWLRWIMVEAASIAARCSQKLGTFHRRVARRHGARTANVALAREMLTICYHLLRKGERYRE